ncbi:hypothetical protein DV736_g2415, partial [Chaetothyriales sp. CBS 134916]
MQWLSIIAYVSSALANRNYYQNDVHYDDGHLGGFPSFSFKTTSYLSPRQNIISFPGSQPCNRDGLHTLLALHGSGVPYPGPIILDSDGSLVWTETLWEQPYNLQIQEYKGEPHLTFWAGSWDLPGHVTGYNYILNSSYHIVKTVRGANNLDPDLHEFTILPSSNTAIIVIAPARQVDLREVNEGPEDGWIWDAGFQEVDLDTGEAVFDWRAYDHIDIDKSYFGRAGGLTADDAHDWFHINSVEKDADGNYLISSRYLHAIFGISGITGNVLWQLGGKGNMFRDLTDYTTDPDRPSPTNIAQQHHARWRDNYTSITLFDNGDNDAKPSHGIWFDIDPITSTVRTRNVYIPPHNIFSGSQGSITVLPNGNVLAGFGSAAQYTEFTPDGTPICEVHFAPLRGFREGLVESYRVFKAKWVGRPQTNPDVLIEDDIVDGKKWMYMSWMGATEVGKWRIEAKGRREEEETEEAITLITVPKDGFETAIDLSRHTVVAGTPEEDPDLRVPAMQKRNSHQHSHQPLHQHLHQPRNQRILIGPKQYSLPVLLTAVTIILLGCTPCLWFLVVWLRKRYDSRKAAAVTAHLRIPEWRRTRLTGGH